MTDTHAAPAVAPDDHAAEHHGAAHPTPRQYVVIGLILAGMTAVEVGLYYFNLGAANNAVLLAIATLKFGVVAAYFMHLKFDLPILRRLFITGIVLAIGVYIAYLLMLGTFIGN
jgi:cytochrome c oxidase subunit 4